MEISFCSELEDIVYCRTHTEQEALYLCIDDNCKESSKICCEQCFQDSVHRQHQFQTFRRVLEQMISQNKSQKINKEDLDIMIEQVHKNKELFDKNIKYAKVQFDQLLYEFEKMQSNQGLDEYILEDLHQQLNNQNTEEIYEKIATVYQEQKIITLNEQKEQIFVKRAKYVLDKALTNIQIDVQNLEKQVILNNAEQEQIRNDLHNIGMTIQKQYKYNRNPRIIHQLNEKQILVGGQKAETFELFDIASGKLKESIVVEIHQVYCISQLKEDEVIYGGSKSGKICSYNFKSREHTFLHEMEFWDYIAKIEVSCEFYQQLLVLGKQQIVLLEKVKNDYQQKIRFDLQEDVTIYPNFNKNSCVLEQYIPFEEQVFVVIVENSCKKTCSLNFYQMNQKKILNTIKSDQYKIVQYFIDVDTKKIYLCQKGLVEVYSYNINQPINKEKQVESQIYCTLKDNQIGGSIYQFRMFRNGNSINVLAATKEKLIIYQLDSYMIDQAENKSVIQFQNQILKKEQLHDSQIDHLFYDNIQKRIVYGTRNGYLYFVE